MAKYRIAKIEKDEKTWYEIRKRDMFGRWTNAVVRRTRSAAGLPLSLPEKHLTVEDAKDAFGKYFPGESAEVES